MWTKWKVNVAVLCFGIARVSARRRQLLPAFLCPATRSTSTGGRHTARQGVTALHGVGEEPVGGVRVSKAGLSPDLQWITDPWDRGVLFSVKVDEVVHDVRTKFQHVQVCQVLLLQIISSVRMV